jgi:predicted aspartyl protease
MKRLYITLYLTLFILSAAAQNAVERVADAINRQDILWIGDHLTTLQDSIPESLSLMAKALWASQTNRYHQSNKAIEKLLNNHAHQIGQDAVGAFYSLLITNLNNEGNYSEAARLTAGNSQNRDVHRLFSAMANKKALQISKPNRDIVIPITRSTLNRGGEHIKIPVTIGRNRELFIFDTGSMKYNVVTESCAKKHKFKPLFDSLPTAGVGGVGYSRVVTLPKIKIGKITIKNPIFIVVPDNDIAVDTLTNFKLEYVLGTDIMEALKEVQFDFAANTMTIPKEQSPKSDNYTPLTHSDNYYIYPTINGSKLQMHFDTGAVSSAMYNRYMVEYGDRINLTGSTRSAHAHGFGGTTSYTVQTVESLNIQLGDQHITVNNIDVTTSDHILPIQRNEYGSLATDILLQFNHITINFKQMFLIAK